MALVVVFVFYAWLGTLVTGTMVHTPLGRLLVRMGFSAPYSSPVFLTLIVLLGLSTASCAWERTASGLRVRRGASRISEGALERLRKRPDSLIALTDDDVSLAIAADTLSASHLRVQRGPSLLAGRSGTLSPWASAVFHWSLVALIAVIAVGHLTRAEVQVGVPVGDTVPVIGAFSQVSKSAWYAGRLGGCSVAVPSLDLTYTVRGVNRGASPLVRVYEDDALIAQGRTYPNHPVRVGSLFVHHGDYGLALDVTVADPSGAQSATQTVLLDFAKTASGTEHKTLDISHTRGTTAQLTLTVPLDSARGVHLDRLPVDPHVIAAVADDGGGARRVTLAVGDGVSLPGRYRLVLRRVRYYERLRVVDDWSVPFIYALFFVALLSLSVALLRPPRTVYALLVRGEGTSALHVAVRCQREDAAFRRHVVRSLQNALADTTGSDIDDR